jgi:hypothetical protein
MNGIMGCDTRHGVRPESRFYKTCHVGALYHVIVRGNQRQKIFCVGFTFAIWSESNATTSGRVTSALRNYSPKC